jgi:DNA-binding MarR family transcriptional regulator
VDLTGGGMMRSGASILLLFSAKGHLPFYLTMVYYLPMASTTAPRIHAAIACLQRLTDLFAERRQQIARSVSLSEQQWAVLEEISSEHFMPSLFAKQRESSAAAVSKILRQLLGKQLVSVQLDDQDGRQRRYELTSKGKRCIEGLRRERETAIRKVWSGLDSDNLDAFTRFGTQLAQRLEEYAGSVTERA